MSTVVFGRRPKVYLPEITAYIDYINNHVDGWTGYDSHDIKDYSPNDFDVVWRFMGMDRSGQGRKIIHEYNSLSTGSFASFKNKMKKACNQRPDGRVFLNRAVKSHFSFNDGVPERMRDMGIDKHFFDLSDVKKEYDFVYSGSLTDRGRVVTDGLHFFKDQLKEYSLLVIGDVPDAIYDYFKDTKNITFTGRVPYRDVPNVAKKAIYGLNLMPDIYPLNAQTATKVIEYCALGLKVVTSDYKWSRKFCRTRQANFFFLKNDFENLTPKNLESFEFKTPSVDDLEWSSLIKSSKIFDLLD